MPSFLALTGLNFDRAYPKLGPEAADRRRTVATTLLLRAIAHAQEMGAEALVFVGGLIDNRSASPQSISYLVQVLDAYPGWVLIAPGAEDPYDAVGIYGVTNWGSRTFVWSTADFAAAPEPLGAVVRGRAHRQGWAATYPPLGVDGGVTVLVGADLTPEPSASWVAGERMRHVITTGTGEARLAGVTVLAPVNPDVGMPWGRAALVTYDNSGVTHVEWVALATEPSAETVEIDVSAFAATEELTSALDRAIVAAPNWSVVRLVGDLSQGVLLPSTSGYASPRGEVAVEADRIGFTFTPLPPADHTALGEFVRSVIDADADERARHQAIALGMAALVPAPDVVEET